MSSIQIVNWQKLLACGPQNAEKIPQSAALALANVDESVAAAALLNTIRQALAAGRKPWLAMSRLDCAEELMRQFSIWNRVLNLGWRVELLPEIQRGKFYVAGGEADRARVLGVVERGEFELLLATLPGLLAPAPRPETLQATEIILKPGMKYPFGQLLEALVKLDYDDEFEVGSPGEFARRGGIVDIFSPAEERPGRIEFFGDEIESIRAFDPETQRSLPGELPGYRIINRCTMQSLKAAEEIDDEEAKPGDVLDFFKPGAMCFWQFQPGQIPEYFRRFGGETEAARFHAFTAALPPGATGMI